MVGCIFLLGNSVYCDWCLIVDICERNFIWSIDWYLILWIWKYIIINGFICFKVIIVECVICFCKIFVWEFSCGEGMVVCSDMIGYFFYWVDEI